MSQLMNSKKIILEITIFSYISESIVYLKDGALVSNNQILFHINDFSIYEILVSHDREIVGIKMEE